MARAIRGRLGDWPSGGGLVTCLNAPARRPSPPLPLAPDPARLAAIGVVLCLHREHDGDLLRGWNHAESAGACAQVDGDGVRESLVFRDGRGHCCWRLFLLPDSHFLAWEQAVAGLPEDAVDAPAELPVPTWPSPPIVQQPLGRRWRASVIRLHATGWPAPGQLAIAAARPSGLGWQTANHIVRCEGAVLA